MKTNITRKSALKLLGTWIAATLGAWFYANQEDQKRDKEVKGVLGINTFDSALWNQPQTVSFDFKGWKQIRLTYGEETIEIDPKEIFEAFKK